MINMGVLKIFVPLAVYSGSLVNFNLKKKNISLFMEQFKMEHYLHQCFYMLSQCHQIHNVDDSSYRHRLPFTHHL